MRYRLLITKVLLSVLLILSQAAAVATAKPVAFTERDTIEFQPARGESLTIPFRLDEQGMLGLSLYSGDGDLVRRLGPRVFEPGHHDWTWDGRDSTGAIIPDEAWYPVLRCDCASGVVTVDPRADTGGVPLNDLGVELSPAGAITYRLPQPARVLVRVGIRSGAMVRVLDTWSPHSPGLVRQSWDGMGAGGVDRVLGHPDLSVLVRAFSLPNHVIITSGHAGSPYRAWRAQRGWEQTAFDPDSVRFQREGEPLARQSQFPVSMLRDPAVSIEIADGAEGQREGLPVVPAAATFRVDMPEADRWLMQRSLYEVGFFLDYRFVSEEETGYTPLSWRWGGNARAGVHTMTVNISGLWGHVGAATVKFRVPERD